MMRNKASTVIGKYKVLTVRYKAMRYKVAVMRKAAKGRYKVIIRRYTFVILRYKVATELQIVKSHNCEKFRNYREIVLNPIGTVKLMRKIAQP